MRACFVFESLMWLVGEKEDETVGEEVTLAHTATRIEMGFCAVMTTEATLLWVAFDGFCGMEMWISIMCV